MPGLRVFGPRSAATGRCRLTNGSRRPLRAVGVAAGLELHVQRRAGRVGGAAARPRGPAPGWRAGRRLGEGRPGEREGEGGGEQELHVEPPHRVAPGVGRLPFWAAAAGGVSW